MKVLLTGSSGLIGSALHSFLSEKGFSVVPLLRRQSLQQDAGLIWNPEGVDIDSASLEGFDVVVHLAGENIAQGVWNEAKQRSIAKSRIHSTHILSHAITQCRYPPKLFIAASAVGYYGNQGDRVCIEQSRTGEGFLAEVCQRWESATIPVREAGIRTVNLRFGIVLSPHGGALSKMLTPFKWGLGGVLGSGSQFMSWVALEDVVNIILYIIQTEKLAGPINVTAPHPVTNREFTKILGCKLHRPTCLHVPAWCLRCLLGKEMADELLLTSTRAIPAQLLQTGYQFLFPTLQSFFNSKTSL